MNDYYNGLNLYLYNTNGSYDYSNNNSSENSIIKKYVGSANQENPSIGKYMCELSTELSSLNNMWSSGN